jgi:replicative DNA helicase
MMNLAREALTSEQPRRVFFITLEMSPKQLLTRLALSLVYAHSAAISEQVKTELEKRERPMRDYYRIVRGLDIDNEKGGAYQMATGITEATNKIKAALENKALTLYDARGASLDAIINSIKANAEKGTLVLLDYIQRMPSPPEVSDSTYMRVKGISDRVLNTAAVTDAVIIAGAQFNRMSKEQGTAKKDPDYFDDASFRESGDLEQDAHCAIGLGWYKNNHNNRFFEVLKVRDEEIPKYPIKLNWRGAFQYMANSGEAITSEKESKEEAPEEKTVHSKFKGGKA